MKWKKKNTTSQNTTVIYFLCTPVWISLITDSQKCPAACVLNGVVTSNQSIFFWEVFFFLKKQQQQQQNFCWSLSYIALCHLLLKLFQKFGSVYLLSVLPALQKGEAAFVPDCSETRWILRSLYAHMWGKGRTEWGCWLCLPLKKEAVLAAKEKQESLCILCSRKTGNRIGERERWTLNSKTKPPPSVKQKLTW